MPRRLLLRALCLGLLLGLAAVLTTAGCERKPRHHPAHVAPAPRRVDPPPPPPPVKKKPPAPVHAAHEHPHGAHPHEAHAHHHHPHPHPHLDGEDGHHHPY